MNFRPGPNSSHKGFQMAQADSKNSTTAPRAMASWFQGTIGDRRDILEGDDFRNRLVARVETPELADQIVAEHNAAVKAALLPVVASRRGFLSHAAGLAAGGTVLALATIPPAPAADALASALDPVFALIAAHRDVNATVHAVEAETSRRLSLGIGDEIDITESAGTEMGLFLELLEIVPTTLAGVVALVAYLDEVNKQDPWKFEDNYATALIGNLAKAFNRIGVAS